MSRYVVVFFSISVLLSSSFAAAQGAPSPKDEPAPAAPKLPPPPAADTPAPGTEAAPSSQPSTAPAEAPVKAPPPKAAGSAEVAAPKKSKRGKALHEAEAAVGRPDPGLVEDDVDASMALLRRGGFSLYMGGMIQVQGAAYVGDEAALALSDPADTEGFRVRRARLGVGGTILRTWSFYLAVDLKDTIVAARGGDVGNELLDAKIEWHRFSFARFTTGVIKVPFSTFSMQSSARQTMIERPLMLQLSDAELVPDRRVGITVSGDTCIGLSYAAGIFNGSNGVTSGNRLAGLAGAAHLQYYLLGKPRAFVPDEVRVAVGAGYMYEDGTAVNSHRVSANLLVQMMRARIMGEFLWMETSPEDQPSGGSVEAGAATRWGIAGEASAFVWREVLQVAFRYEYFQNVDTLPTFGNTQLFTVGVNAYLYRNKLKAQINYVHRDEKDGPEFENDIAFAQLQAMF